MCELLVFRPGHISIVLFIVVPVPVSPLKASFVVPFRDAVQQSQVFSLNLRDDLPFLSFQPGFHLLDQKGIWNKVSVLFGLILQVFADRKSVSFFVLQHREHKCCSSPRHVWIFLSDSPTSIIWQTQNVAHIVNPLTPELNPSAQRCLTRYFTGDFAFWTVHFVNIWVKNQQIHQLFIQFINYVW
jgi:hypothetical protein